MIVASDMDCDPSIDDKTLTVGLACVFHIDDDSLRVN